MAIKGALSPSALGKFLDCPRCFWLGKKGLKDYRGIMASIPNAIDACLKDYHDEHRMKGLLPPEVGAQIPGGKAFTELVKLNRWRSLGQGISATIDGVAIMGLLDDLLLFEDGTAAGMDYKSNKSPRTPEYAANFYGHQLALYNLLLEANGFKVRPKGYLSFWSPKPLVGSGDAKSRTTQFPFDCTVHEIDADPASAREIIKNAVACLAGPLPEPDGECELCLYVKSRGQRMTEIVTEAKRQREAAAAAQTAIPGAEPAAKVEA